VRSEDQPEAANSAVFGTFDDCGVEIGRLFLKISLKSGAYGRILEQDEW
jgi:hypothetical protein